ncbi:MAG: hypothetical protein II464_08055 [Oscillospiraceae bacterium]|jgi:hypothetical protein|nr:hypothetical protein [Oscillospiraceae bacterium]MBQ3999700.1 hypothetical protein [Oscillospiraceae bacterium]MBQ4239945.1 hypothetical protein [Oscillospiraceae bacterium]
MALNPMVLLKIRKMWGQFTSAHPRLLPYINELRSSGYVGEGSVIDVTVTSPDGRDLRYNMRVTADDLELIGAVTDIGRDSSQ